MKEVCGDQIEDGEGEGREGKRGKRGKGGSLSFFGSSPVSGGDDDDDGKEEGPPPCAATCPRDVELTCALLREYVDGCAKSCPAELKEHHMKEVCGDQIEGGEGEGPEGKSGKGGKVSFFGSSRPVSGGDDDDDGEEEGPPEGKR